MEYHGTSMGYLGTSMEYAWELSPTHPGSTRRLRGEYAESPPIYFVQSGTPMEYL